MPEEVVTPVEAPAAPPPEQPVETWKERYDRQRREAQAKVTNDIIGLIDKLKEKGCTSATIEFDGSGDSGEIHDISLEGGDSAGFLKVDDGLWRELSDWALLVIEGTGVDWYNDSGGFGSIIINTALRTYEFEVYQRYEESNLEAQGTVDVDTA